ncbi:MAG: hypothetical protein LUE29_07445, partial [Lachnospiraceae bacterium]|nr:hypothetical protein [Lachnospiraceae bacterium]
MKYTLQENAVSSLTIALSNFKKMFYVNYRERLSKPEIDEAKKLCVVFLENAVELMLKAIISTKDPLQIYKEPNSRKIQAALSEVTETNKLEDILISKGDFQTITYSEAVDRYIKMFGGSDKEYQILIKLSRRRNAITHFGIDDTADYNELTIDLLCTFDVIYNYLYPYLIELDDVGQYFTSDDIEVETIYGKKPILDDDFSYNNIIDTIYEILVDSSKKVASKIRARNPKSKICEFQEIFADLLGDKKFYDMLNNFNIYIKFDEND